MIYRQKYVPLADVCDIQSGFTARSALVEDRVGGIPAVQLGDLRGDIEVPLASASRFKLDGKLDRYLVSPGDVLFRSRGEKNTAVIAVGDAGDQAIALLPLIVLRAHADVVLPEFLMWLINQPEAQRYLDSCARGTNLRMIPRDCLDKLPVSIPDLVIQKLVVEVSRLAAKEASLLRELAQKKEEFTSFALLRQVRNAQLHGNEAGHPVARQPSKHAGK
ncbi:restriction endonuclease subunit S [Vannielia sp.]|uniref:restriction endonuclease subunit S n=1 Tax=Vannielia sp. TaxID=2813045 RepID=UPI0026151495|nr:restriction endonuclease subunit S [Vannielia sp.]MDF1871975.1 restriction endonuclease subunit S [Vannielia sp.]